jgi:hypothetical protein
MPAVLFSHHKDHRDITTNRFSSEATEMNPTFRTIFFTTVAITVYSFGTSLYFSAQPHLSKEQAQIFDNCNKISMGGSVAVFGLLARRKLK